MMRLYLGFALIVLLSATATANDASIVGTWKFQSFFREVIATGERQNEFGERPSGYISYQPDGRMFAMLVGDNRIKPSGAFPTDEEKLKLFGTLIAYSGTYVVDGDKITHKIDVSWNQKWTGTDEVRFYKIEDRTLTITTAVNKNPRDGRDGRGGRGLHEDAIASAKLLSASDVACWHQPDQPSRSSHVRCSGRTGSRASGPSGPLLTQDGHSPELSRPG